MAGSSLSSLSPIVAFIYIFNLIVGVGSLALPLSFSKSGLILGSCFLALLALLAYMSVTFVIEAMACANFVSQMNERGALLGNYQPVSVVSEGASLNEVSMLQNKKTSLYEIDKKVEMGEMASMFLGSVGAGVFYLFICVYLYGDLIIYAVSVAKTLSSFVGAFTIGSLDVSEEGSYYVFLALFACTVVPFCFMTFTNTKFLQILCLAIRNTSLLLMIILAFIRISSGQYAPISEVPMFHVQSLPVLYGTSIYAFMCHHSLPSIVTPITDKRNLNRLFFWCYALILLIYVILCVSANFAFPSFLPEKCPSFDGPACRLQELYSLNFSSYHVRFLADFLTLFPVFTLTSSFPVITATLSNNLKSLFVALRLYETVPRRDVDLSCCESFLSLCKRKVFVLIALVPPFIVAYFYKDVTSLVSITGSFAGLAIQYLIPSILVLFARRYISLLKTSAASKSEFESDTSHYVLVRGSSISRTKKSMERSSDSLDHFEIMQQDNPHQSIFSSNAWLYLIFVWCFLSTCVSIFNLTCNSISSCKAMLN